MSRLSGQEHQQPQNREVRKTIHSSNILNDQGCDPRTLILSCKGRVAWQPLGWNSQPRGPGKPRASRESLQCFPERTKMGLDRDVPWSHTLPPISAGVGPQTFQARISWLPTDVFNLPPKLRKFKPEIRSLAVLFSRSFSVIRVSFAIIRETRLFSVFLEDA